MNFTSLGEISNGKRPDKIVRKRMKLTVHRTGRAGFSSIAGETMGLSKELKILFAVNGEDVYAKVTSEDERGYDIRFSAKYFSIDMRPLLEQLGVDYSDLENTTIFDIALFGEDEDDGAKIWKLTKRVVKVNGSQNQDL